MGQAAEPATAPALAVSLLGGLAIRTPSGAEAGLPTAKAALLFAYLAALPGRMHRRSRLAGLFWPNRGEEQARGSLRHALSRIRAIGGQILVQGEALSLLPLETDLARLEAAQRGVPVTPEAALEFARPFLDGIEAGEGELQDWLAFERARCRTLAQQVLARLARERLAEGEEEVALMLATRLVALDPYREQSHRLPMSPHAAAGDRSKALAQFRTCRDLLQAELGVAPSARTEALAREIAGSGPVPEEAGARPRPQAGEHDSAPREARPSNRTARDGTVPDAAEPPRREADEFRLSIAVVPYLTPNGDEEESFLAEGLAQDIITELSRHRDFLVIAGPSSCRFGCHEATRALGVRYVLVVAVRRQGGRISLSLGLLDEDGRRSLWAVRREGAVSALYDMQDAVVAEVAANLDAEIRQAECESAVRRAPASLDAWALFHRGLWHAYRFHPAEVDRAEECFRRAIALAPEFALPHAGLAFAGLIRIGLAMTPAPKAVTAAATLAARRAFDLDPTSPFVLAMLGRLLGHAGQFTEAFALLRLARQTHPSYAHVHYYLALTHQAVGEPAPALEAVRLARRLSPRDPLTFNFQAVEATTLFLLDRREEAEAGLRAALAQAPQNLWPNLLLAVLLAEAGRGREAGAHLAALAGGGIALSAPLVAPLIRRVLPREEARLFTALSQAAPDLFPALPA